MKKLSILSLCVLAISFFIYKVMANRSNKESSAASIPTNSTPIQTPSKNESSNEFKKVSKLKPSNYDKVTKMMATSIKNDPTSFKRLIANPGFKKLFKSDAPVDGFYASDYYHIQYYISKVSTSDEHPSQILIEGLTKYKKNIRRIKGYFDVTDVVINKKDPGEQETNTNFCVKGIFHFDETHGSSPVGVYQGDWVADVSEIDDPTHTVEFAYCNESIAHGNQLLLNGTWQGVATKEVKQLCFSQMIESIGAEIFNAFSFGDRETTLNDMYASKGWKDYYENEEWWNKAENQ